MPKKKKKKKRVLVFEKIRKKRRLKTITREYIYGIRVIKRIKIMH